MASGNGATLQEKLSEMTTFSYYQRPCLPGFGLSEIKYVMEWNWEKSEKEFLRALAINPSDALSSIFYAQLLMVLQRDDEALTQGQLAMSLDPLNPSMKWWYSALLYGLGDCKTPLSIAEDVLAVDPGNWMFNNLIVSAAFQCKEYDKVIKAERYNLPNIILVKEDFFKEIERIYSEHGFV
jgi:tetratricopeptide (TPR) repeat protein